MQERFCRCFGVRESCVSEFCERRFAAFAAVHLIERLLSVFLAGAETVV
mgnify:CR=1 FL=1